MNSFERWSDEDLLLFLKEAESKGKRITNALTNHLSAAATVRTELTKRLKHTGGDISLMHGNQPVTVTTVGISYEDKNGNKQLVNIDVARNRKLPVINDSCKTELVLDSIRNKFQAES